MLAAKSGGRDGAELIASFIVQPLELVASQSGWNVMMNKLSSNFHGCLPGQGCIACRFEAPSDRSD